MATAPFDHDGKGIGGGKERPRTDRELAHGQAGHVVHAVDLLDVPAVHHAVVAHHLAATAAFFGRLEDHHHRAVEVAGFAQVFRGPQQHGGMPVMAAGMHHARGFRGMRGACRLDDRQRVHVGAQPDDLARGIGPPPDHADNPGAADARHDLIAAEFAQAVGHDACGAMHLEQKLGVFVEIAPPCGDFGLHLGDAVLDGHGRSFQAESGRRCSVSATNHPAPAGMASSLKSYCG